MSKTVDFDAFRAEQKADPVILTVGGKEYALPAALPAALALDVVRLHETLGETENVKVDDLMKIGAALFGGDDAFRDVLTEAKVTLDELPDLVKMVIEAYAVAPPNPTAQE